MADYAQSLNKDTVNNLFTSARWDAGNSQWMNDSAMWHKVNGVLVPTGDVNALPVTLSGSNIADTAGIPVKNVTKSIITTIINAQSVAAGGYISNQSLGLDGTESEVYVFVNTDKQPWGISGRNRFTTPSVAALYPQKNNFATAYADLQIPSVQIFIGDGTLGNPSSVTEALAWLMPYTNAAYVTFLNQHATDVATVTVRVLRVWRTK